MPINLKEDGWNEQTSFIYILVILKINTKNYILA